MLMLKCHPIGITAVWLLAATAAQSAPRADQPTGQPGAARPVEVQESTGQRRIQAANAFLAAARTAYMEGTLTIDRYISASQRLAQAEAGAAGAGARRAAWQAHVDRLRSILKLEQERFKAARGTATNLAEASLALAEAEDDLAGMP